MTQAQEGEPRKSQEIIRPDLNIERWQIFATSQFKGASRVLERGNSKVAIGRVKDGKEPDGYREVGVLRIPEMKCFYALVELWEGAGKPSNANVEFSLHEIARILGLSWSGRTFALIEEWLDRLKKIPIDWINAYYQKDMEVTESVLQSFTILNDLVIFKRSVSGQLSLALSSFRFHERIVRNLLDRNTKPLRLDQILALEKEISILLYRHLDLVMADKGHYERTAAGLLTDDLQLVGSRYRYPSRRAQVLAPAFDELEGLELSTGVLTGARLERTADGRDWKGVFEKRPSEASTGQRRGQKLSAEQTADVEGTIETILMVTGDDHSRAFYAKLARRCLEVPQLQDLIYRALSEIQYEVHEGRIQKSPGAAFTDKLKRFCDERGIDLRLGATNSPDSPA
ncbi:MAG: hypothetical protein ABEL51_13475 [Salinibacter sp.]